MQPVLTAPGTESSRPLEEGTRRRWQQFVTLTGFLWAITLFTMTLGPYVRAEEAGLACPDWPLCYGRVIPPFEYRIYLEFIHRVAAGLMSLGFLGWLFFVGAERTLRREFLGPALLALLLLVVQILLGGATITQRLDAYIVKSHLLNALLYLSVLVYVWKKASALLQGPVNLAPGRAVIRGQQILLGLIFFQIFLGGRLSAGQAGLDCPEFPACYVHKVPDGDLARLEPVYFPSLQDETYERPMSHRLVGYGLVLLSLWLVFHTRGTPLGSKNALLFALLCVQILLGGLNVKWGLPVPIRVLHSVTGITLYITALLNLLEIRYHEPIRH